MREKQAADGGLRWLCDAGHDAPVGGDLGTLLLPEPLPDCCLVLCVQLVVRADRRVHREVFVVAASSCVDALQATAASFGGELHVVSAASPDFVPLQFARGPGNVMGASRNLLTQPAYEPHQWSR